MIYKKSHALNQVILFGFLYFWGFLRPSLLKIEWSLVLNFFFLDDLLKLCLFARCLYLHHNWWKETETKTDSSNIFEGCYWEKNNGNS